MMIKSSDLLGAAKFFSTISHTNGRLRVRISSKIKDFLESFNDSDYKNLNLKNDINLDEIIKKIDGVKDVKLNLLMGSATIFYDPNIIPRKFWDDYINGENRDEVLEILDRYYDKLYYQG